MGTLPDPMRIWEKNYQQESDEELKMRGLASDIATIRWAETHSLPIQIMLAVQSLRRMLGGGDHDHDCHGSLGYRKDHSLCIMWAEIGNPGKRMTWYAMIWSTTNASGGEEALEHHPASQDGLKQRRQLHWTGQARPANLINGISSLLHSCNLDA